MISTAADLEIRDTADLEVGATGEPSRCTRCACRSIPSLICPPRFGVLCRQHNMSSPEAAPIEMPTAPQAGRLPRKLMVANRSEIAIRVFRAATELGFRT